MNSTLDNWTAREAPLQPLAVAGRGGAAFGLARRLLDRSDEELRRLRGAASGSASEPAILVVSGPSELLPWAPEAIYLGREAEAPALLWPIHLAPPFAPDLMERALRRRFSDASAPLILVPQWQLASALGVALPVKRDFITRFLVGENP